MNNIRQFEEAVLSCSPLDGRDAARLVELSEAEPWELFHSANRIRERFKGKTISLCSIVNARSGACSEDCAFCSQSAGHKTGVPAYGLLSAEKMLDAARAAAASGSDCFGIVTSGKGPGSEKDISTIRETIRSIDFVEACASLGTLTPQDAAGLRAAGLARYHHNLETARSFFPEICTTHSYDSRVATVKAAKAAGLATCCGGIFGLGESWAQRIEMAMELRGLGVESVPINFLNPVQGTRLGHLKPLPALEGLRIIALYRFLLPDSDLKVAGGRAPCLGDLQSWMFYAGANSLMIGHYLTTPGRSVQDDLKMIRDLGLVPGRRGSACGEGKES